jgi:glycine C-acetyltransferase
MNAYAKLQSHLADQLKQIRDAGLYKGERVLVSGQQPHVAIKGRDNVLNLCANNYLGLANHPEVVAAAKQAMDRYGYGMASVRFICGTQELHKQLEQKISEFLGTEDTILYSSCWDANGGLFETILGPEDAVISDELNHASIIDGVRLCKAQRHRYKNNDMADLEAKLNDAQSANARFKLIATDGVFSMDGTIANLAAGFIGKKGRGAHEHHNVIGKIDVITGTLGKALGGGSGGYTSGRKEIIDFLRQRSRPYLFSNSLPPPIVAASLKAIELLQRSTELRDKLETNTKFFRAAMGQSGFNIVPGTHPITPIMLGDAVVAAKMAEKMLEKGVYVIGFSFPVVPQGKARIRTQLSAAHSREDLEFAVKAFTEVKREMSI